MNPDRIFRKRNNANRKDLNRNFNLDPDYSYQPETLAIINNTDQYNYVLDMECHDGARLITFPFDEEIRKVSQDHPSFIYLCQEYLKLNPIFQKNPKPKRFNLCYVMGSKWYSIKGSIRDYMYIKKNIPGLTIEFSARKQARPEKIDQMYIEHKPSLIRFLEMGLECYTGIVKTKDGKIINQVEINIRELENKIVNINQDGYFYVFLKPGEYHITFNTSNYNSQTKIIKAPLLNDIVILN